MIGRKADAFLNKHYSGRRNDQQPFLMVLSTPAPHAPFTPAPQYAKAFSNLTAPRTPAYNHVENAEHKKHWFVRTRPRPLPEKVLAEVDEVFRNRWRTLLSVDDLVDGVMKRLEDLGVLDETFVVFTSDHGFHLGQFGLAVDKRQMYETDLRVPLLVRGPGVRVNVTLRNPVTNVDLAPTFVEMAGGRAPDSMDGTSFLPFLLSESNSISAPEPQHSFLVEYQGEGGKSIDPACRSLTDDNMAECQEAFGCKCQDSRNNTYNCLRTVSSAEDTIYCKFEDDVGFVEMYNLAEDRYQLFNLGSELSDDTKTVYEGKINGLRDCHGRQECFV